jgi:NTP pyrophosphatase (non-canonical NTP hydrolase)
MADDILDKLTALACKFRDERNWKQFHNPKDMALSLVLEASELLELMQWKNGAELAQHLAKRREELGDELCDVLYWVLVIAHDHGIDLRKAFQRKIRKNRAKYPVHKAHGRAAKYTEL